MADISIRYALTADANEIAAIYDWHARTGTATFDLDGPPADEWSIKLTQITTRGWPFLVAERSGRVIAYAFVTQFRDRPAYSASCEDSIYVNHEHVGKGIGQRLLEQLLIEARDCGFKQMIAVVGGAEPASIALHARLGFVERGRMKDVGRKFGRDLDTVYLQRTL